MIRRPIHLKDITLDLTTADGRTRLTELRAAAVRLRNFGMPVDTIADKLQISSRDAESLIEQAVREVMDASADEMLTRQQHILNDMTQALYPRVLEGENDATNMMLKVMDHGAKLHGLHAPQRLKVGVDRDGLVLSAEQALAQLGMSIDADVVEVETDDEPWANT